MSDTQSDSSVIEVLKKCSVLTSLSIASPTNVPTTVLADYLASHAGNLFALDVSTSELNDDMLRAALPHLPHLQSLTLNGCVAVTGAIADYLPQLGAIRQFFRMSLLRIF